MSDLRQDRSKPPLGQVRLEVDTEIDKVIKALEGVNVLDYGSLVRRLDTDPHLYTIITNSFRKVLIAMRKVGFDLFERVFPSLMYTTLPRYARSGQQMVMDSEEVALCITRGIVPLMQGRNVRLENSQSLIDLQDKLKSVNTKTGVRIVLSNYALLDIRQAAVWKKDSVKETTFMLTTQVSPTPYILTGSIEVVARAIMSLAEKELRISQPEIISINKFTTG